MRAYRSRKPAAPAPDLRPPVLLTRIAKWVRRGADKRPLDAHTGRAASVTDASTWSTWSAARASRHGKGPGFVLDVADRIVCIDLDHCIDEDGTVADWALAILEACPDTYVETSPSGTGLHIWGRGQLERGRKIRDGERAIEVYGHGRYIALGTPRPDAPKKLADLTELVATLTAPTDPPPARKETDVSRSPDPDSGRTEYRTGRAEKAGSDLYAQSGDPAPELPNAHLYQGETRAWYNRWTTAPTAKYFKSTDWGRLHMLAPLVDQYWTAPNERTLAVILRGESSLGATVIDRLKLLDAEAGPKRSETMAPAPAENTGEMPANVTSLDERRKRIAGG
jgi:hypothetical protein